MILGSWGVISIGSAVLNVFDEKDKSCTAMKLINYVMQFYTILLLDPTKSMYELEFFQSGVLLELLHSQSQDICPMTLLFEIIPIVYQRMPSGMVFNISIQCDQVDNLDNQVSHYKEGAMLTTVSFDVCTNINNNSYLISVLIMTMTIKIVYF